MNRKTKIVKLLIDNEKFYSYDELSSLFNVSTRSIRNDLNELKKFFDDNGIKLKYNKNLGIAIDHSEITKDILNNCINKLSVENEFSEKVLIERMTYYILLSKNQFSVKELSDALKIGRNLTIKCLGKTEEWLSLFDLLIVRKKHTGMTLQYKEYNWRLAMLSLLQKNKDNLSFNNIFAAEDIENLFVEDSRNDFFSKINKEDLVLVKNFIKKYEGDNNIHFSDESFVNIIIYIVIAELRIKSNNQINMLINYDEYDNKASKWLKDNIWILEQGLGIYFSKQEIITLLFIYMSSNTIGTATSDAKEEDLYLLIRKYLEYIESKLYIKFNEKDELLERLHTHLTPAIYRMKFNIYISNPLLEDVRKLYPYIFEVCKDGLDNIEKRFDITFNLDEVSFITLYIVSSIEQQRKVIEYFHNVVIVCTGGLATSNMLRTRILTEFPNIIVKNIYSYKEFKKADLSDIELVIGTVPIRDSMGIPTIHVSPLLNHQDKQLIKGHLINGINLKEKREIDGLINNIMAIVVKECNVEDYTKLENKVRTLFSTHNINSSKLKRNYSLVDFLEESQIQIQESADSWEDAIYKATLPMIKNKKVKKAYYDALIDSCKDLDENLIITDGILLPHVNQNENVFKTSISFLTLKKPVKYGKNDNLIWFVIVLSSNLDNSHVRAIGELANLLINEQITKKIRRLKNKEEFISLIKNFEKVERAYDNG